MSLLINGKAYAFGDATVETFPGVAEHIQSIGWDESVAKKRVYGKGRIPKGVSVGAYEGGFELGITYEGFLILKQAATALGGLFFMPAFPIIVSFATDNSPTALVTLANCEFDKRTMATLQKGSEEEASVTLTGLCIVSDESGA